MINPLLKDYLIKMAVDLFEKDFPTQQEQVKLFHQITDEVGKVLEKYKISQLICWLDSTLECILTEWFEDSVKEGQRLFRRHSQN